MGIIKYIKAIDIAKVTAWKINTVEKPLIQYIKVPIRGPIDNPIPFDVSTNPITSSTLSGYKILIIAYEDVYIQAYPNPINILQTIAIIRNKV